MRKWLPKIGLLLVLFMLITGIVLAMDKSEEPVKEAPEAGQAEISFTAETPVAMTSPGQSQKMSIVSLFARRVELEIKTDNFLDIDGLEDIKSLIIIIGAVEEGCG